MAIASPIVTAILVLGGTNTITGNEIVGIGQDGGLDPDNPMRFPITTAGIEVNDFAVATVSANSIRDAFVGLSFGFHVAVTGTDNVVNDVAVGIQAVTFSTPDDPANVTISSSDFTNYVRAMDVSSLPSEAVLICNWWGFAAGPTAGPENPIAANGVFTPWATVPVAGTTTTECFGGL